MNEPFDLVFNKLWFPSKDSVDDLLLRLDMGESIPIADLKRACEKEGREFKIVFEE